ncbi:MAG TPA: 7-cyano-7-deazaguanine synthase [Acidimicrobiales bacterium]
MNAGGLPTDRATVAVLASGGLDSAILVGELLRQGRAVQPIYIRFGLTWEAVEETHLRRFLETMPARGLVTLGFPIADVYGAHWSLSATDVPDADSPDDAVYLPGRNLLLVAKAAVWCALHDISTIALGTLKGNPFSDSSATFFAGLASVVQTGLDWPFEIVTPFSELTKAHVLDLGRELPLQHTFSCIQPEGEQHCGRCNKCAERRRAFSDLSLEDVTAYATA